MPKRSVQIEEVARLEERLAASRRAAANALRSLRERRGLSLRQVSPHVQLSAGALSQLERGESWETQTAARVAAFLESDAAKAA